MKPPPLLLPSPEGLMLFGEAYITRHSSLTVQPITCFQFIALAQPTTVYLCVYTVGQTKFVIL